MKHLEISKSVPLLLPTYTKCKFVRTGVPRDNHLSFIHCLLHASFNDYSMKSLQNKNEMAVLVKDKIAKGITKNDWEHFGSEWRDKFEDLLIRTTEQLYAHLKLSNAGAQKSKTVRRIFERIVKNKDVDKYMPVYQILLKEIKFSNFSTIYRKCFDECSSKAFDDCKDTILLSCMYLITKILRNVDIAEKKKETFSEKFIFLVKTILSEVENEIVEKVRKEIYEANTPFNVHILKTIADKFERDIYFIDSNSLLPTVPACWSNKGNRHFVILMMIGSSYEVVGRVVDDSNKVQRSFPPNDPLVSAFLNKKKRSYHRAQSVSSSHQESSDTSSSVSTATDEDEDEDKSSSSDDDDEVDDNEQAEHEQAQDQQPENNNQEDEDEEAQAQEQDEDEEEEAQAQEQEEEEEEAQEQEQEAQEQDEEEESNDEE